MLQAAGALLTPGKLETYLDDRVADFALKTQG
jgi:hypothetical protein